jgi:membrane associated rhomboid family serine protease
MRLSRHPTLVFVLCVAMFVAGAGTALFGFTSLGYGQTLAESVAIIAAGAGVIAGSVALALATERQMRRDEQVLSAAGPPIAKGKTAKAPSTPPKTRPDRVLAEWALKPDEWRAFNAQLSRARMANALQNTLVGALVGAALAWGMTGKWRFAPIGLAIAALIALAGTFLTAQGLKNRPARAGARVILRRHSVEVDGEKTVLCDDAHWLSAAHLREDLPFAVLELDVSRVDARGATPKPAVVRVPVPRGSVADARGALADLRRGLPADAEG